MSTNHTCVCVRALPSHQVDTKEPAPANPKTAAPAPAAAAPSADDAGDAGDGHNALLAAIRGGAKLRKVCAGVFFGKRVPSFPFVLFVAPHSAQT